jgi:replication-associated recombination protein RarA
MIYGPPGVGKTFLAHAAAIEGCCAFFPISATEFNPFKSSNNPVHKMKLLFELAM